MRGLAPAALRIAAFLRPLHRAHHAYHGAVSRGHRRRLQRAYGDGGVTQAGQRNCECPSHGRLIQCHDQEEGGVSEQKIDFYRPKADLVHLVWCSAIRSFTMGL